MRLSEMNSKGRWPLTQGYIPPNPTKSPATLSSRLTGNPETLARFTL